MKNCYDEKSAENYETYDEKSAEKLPKLLRCRKVYNFKLSKLLIPNFSSINLRRE